MCTDRLYTMNDLPSDLLRRILTNLLELCRLSTRGVLTRVCKSWAGVVQAHEELFLSPDCLDGLGLLTQDQSQRFNNTLSNIKPLRTKCLLSYQVGQAIQVAQACPKLRVLEVHVNRKYDDFKILDDEARSKFAVLLIDLLCPSSWASRLQKLSLHASDMTLLTMVITSPLDGNILDCITAGHIEILRLALPSFQPSIDVMARECMPALQFLEVLKVSDLYISEGTIARVNLIDSLQSVDLACSKPLCQMHVDGCPGKGLTHLRSESFNIIFTEQVAQWLADLQRSPRYWRVFVNLGSGRYDIDIVEVEQLK